VATANETRRIAWAIFWRAGLTGILLGLVSGFVFGFVVSFTGAMVGRDRQLLQQISGWGGGILGLIASFLSLNYFIAWSIGRPIGGKTLSLSA
jgi:Mg/Co/Ni transporter MgtE